LTRFTDIGVGDNMYSRLKKTFKMIACRTFHILHCAKKMEYQPKEETFTDLNVMCLKKTHPDEISVRTFTNVEEGSTGADWEWWLTNSSGKQWLGLRVQAKILNLSSNSFKGLFYTGSNGKSQMDKLIDDAAEHRMIPIYCLYTLTPQDFKTETPVVKHGCVIIDGYYGCSLLPVCDAYNLASKKIYNIKEVMQKSYPWHWLFCWISTWKKDAHELGGFFKIMGGKPFLKEPIENYLHEKPPDYVASMIKKGKASDHLAFEIENPSNCRGILVFAPKQPSGD